MNGWNGDGPMAGGHMGWGWMPVWWGLGLALCAVLVWVLLRSRRPSLKADPL